MTDPQHQAKEETPTPITDNREYHPSDKPVVNWVAASFARQLERELSEARALVEKTQAHFASEARVSDSLRAQLQKALREKEEATKAFEVVLRTVQQSRNDHQRNSLQYAAQAADLRAQLSAALKERDGANTIIRNLWPFVIEDYFPNCATAEWKAAVEAARPIGESLAQPVKWKEGE